MRIIIIEATNPTEDIKSLIDTLHEKGYLSDLPPNDHVHKIKSNEALKGAVVINSFADMPYSWEKNKNGSLKEF